MKKEIMALVNCTEGSVKMDESTKQKVGSFRINNMSKVRRNYKEPMEPGDLKVDNLELVFDRINNVEFSGHFTIKSRDFDGIIAEIEQYTTAFMAAVSETLCRNLRNGYINA